MYCVHRLQEWSQIHSLMALLMLTFPCGNIQWQSPSSLSANFSDSRQAGDNKSAEKHMVNFWSLKSHASLFALVGMGAEERI